MLHSRGERSIYYEVAQLLVNLLDLCSGRVAYPIDEPESVEAKTTVDQVFWRDGWELPTAYPLSSLLYIKHSRVGYSFGQNVADATKVGGLR